MTGTQTLVFQHVPVHGYAQKCLQFAFEGKIEDSLHQQYHVIRTRWTINKNDNAMAKPRGESPWRRNVRVHSEDILCPCLRAGKHAGCNLGSRSSATSWRLSDASFFCRIYESFSACRCPSTFEKWTEYLGKRHHYTHFFAGGAASLHISCLISWTAHRLSLPT